MGHRNASEAVRTADSARMTISSTSNDSRLQRLLLLRQTRSFAAHLGIRPAGIDAHSKLARLLLLQFDLVGSESHRDFAFGEFTVIVTEDSLAVPNIDISLQLAGIRRRRWLHLGPGRLSKKT